jgi:hypothetical protein
MGWNTSALFIFERSTEDLINFLPDVFDYTATAEVDGEQAMSGSPGGRIYVAHNGAWCEMWDPDERFPPRVDAMIEQDGERILRHTRALAVLFSSVTSTYGLWLYDDGRLGRHAMYESGDLVASLGEALPIEAELPIPTWGPDEAFLWGVIEHVTRLTYDLDRTYTAYTVTP